MSRSPSLSFDIESIREIAQLLRDGDLGEICLETTSTDEATGITPARLRLKRPIAPQIVVAAPAPAAASEPSTPPPASTESGGEAPRIPATFEINSHAVGVFREAKIPLKVGDEVKVRQVLGSVESLRVPNEIVAPSAGRILDISTQDGQGVEYGQTLFVLEEI